MSGVYYHIAAFACEKDTSARLTKRSLLPYDWLTGHLHYCCKSTPLGVREPSYSYSPRTQYVKQLLLVALAGTTNRGRVAHDERGINSFNQFSSLINLEQYVKDTSPVDITEQSSIILTRTLCNHKRSIQFYKICY